ncbi:MAG: 3-dehydroquinate synthase [Chitinophagales bacterium]|nr:3-dehydroquinate synthase [Chitinophagales bacterium]
MKVNLCLGAYSAVFKDFIASKPFTKIFLVTDETVWGIYGEEVRNAFDLTTRSIFILPSGESCKTLENIRKTWSFFIDKKVDKSTLVIAFGGGSVSDSVGFAASTFKRGIETLYIPTTLLAQVDAAIGGKTAINIGGVKNVVGTFSFPLIIISDTHFLKSLPSDEIKNGIAEMLKHSLLCSKEYFDKLNAKTKVEEFINEDLIIESAKFKTKVVEEDPFDKSERKQLNFGHTIGHAIESLLLQQKKDISHGAAVAAGLVMETYLSYKYFELNRSVYEDVLTAVSKYFDKVQFTEPDFEMLIDLMTLDKKNIHNEIFMVILRDIGQQEILAVSPPQIREALHVYINL